MTFLFEKIISLDFDILPKLLKGILTENYVKNSGYNDSHGIINGN